mgnify:CR=1 FL=1
MSSALTFLAAITTIIVVLAAMYCYEQDGIQLRRSRPRRYQLNRWWIAGFILQWTAVITNVRILMTSGQAAAGWLLLLVIATMPYLGYVRRQTTAAN